MNKSSASEPVTVWRHYFAIILAYIPIILKRIRNEEEVLTKGLPGYAEYKNKVKYRLFLFLW